LTVHFGLRRQRRGKTHDETGVHGMTSARQEAGRLLHDGYEAGMFPR